MTLKKTTNFQHPQFLGSTDSIAIFEVVKKEKLLSGKPQSWLLGIYLHNGKKAFEFETNSKDKYSFFPMNVTKLEGNSTLLYQDLILMQTHAC